MEPNGTVTISIAEFDRLRDIEKNMYNKKTFEWNIVYDCDYEYGYRSTYKTYVFDDDLFHDELKKELEKYNESKLKLNIYERIFNNCSATCNNRKAWRKWRQIFIEKYSHGI